MPELLVSVRHAQEALTALEAGAALIDVKEPAHGSLGRADRSVIDAVLAAVEGRRPVSAACGELCDSFADLPSGLQYAKWGLAGCRSLGDWQTKLLNASQALPSIQPVAVAYADWELAAAPTPADVIAFACEQRWPAFLLDTFTKDGRTLLDWLSLREIVDLSRSCRRTGIRVALAGSLRENEIRLLLPAEPDWFAVRSAACLNGKRNQGICRERVRALVKTAKGV